jgi:hypothetical protein
LLRRYEIVQIGELLSDLDNKLIAASRQDVPIVERRRRASQRYFRIIQERAVGGKIDDDDFAVVILDHEMAFRQHAIRIRQNKIIARSTTHGQTAALHLDGTPIARHHTGGLEFESHRHHWRSASYKHSKFTFHDHTTADDVVADPRGGHLADENCHGPFDNRVRKGGVCHVKNPRRW